MFRKLPIKLGNLSSSHPILYWVLDCMVFGFLLSLKLVLCLTLLGGFLILYEYVFYKGQEPELELFVAFVLYPIAMGLGYPWVSMLYGDTGYYPAYGVIGCIVLNGLLAGWLYGCIALLIKTLITRN
ncbi:MAG: hypothetical protein WAW36_00790 [Methylovulum miyakonense]|uniref:hypothetical protein n=1 Tax=Methylovulum miyakonense TaxID=645578 RepID=UPI003BB78346